MTQPGNEPAKVTAQEHPGPQKATAPAAEAGAFLFNPGFGVLAMTVTVRSTAWFPPTQPVKRVAKNFSKKGIIRGGLSAIPGLVKKSGNDRRLPLGHGKAPSRGSCDPRGPPQILPRPDRCSRRESVYACTLGCSASCPCASIGPR
jgi:hypothetical protein